LLLSWHAASSCTSQLCARFIMHLPVMRPLHHAPPLVMRPLHHAPPLVMRPLHHAPPLVMRPLHHAPPLVMRPLHHTPPLVMRPLHHAHYPYPAALPQDYLHPAKPSHAPASSRTSPWLCARFITHIPLVMRSLHHAPPPVMHPLHLLTSVLVSAWPRPFHHMQSQTWRTQCKSRSCIFIIDE
jgi:hypothetical protein